MNKNEKSDNHTHTHLNKASDENDTQMHANTRRKKCSTAEIAKKNPLKDYLKTVCKKKRKNKCIKALTYATVYKSLTGRIF